MVLPYIWFAPGRGLLIGLVLVRPWVTGQVVGLLVGLGTYT